MPTMQSSKNKYRKKRKSEKPERRDELEKVSGRIKVRKKKTRNRWKLKLEKGKRRKNDRALIDGKNVRSVVQEEFKNIDNTETFGNSYVASNMRQFLTPF